MTEIPDSSQAGCRPILADFPRVYPIIDTAYLDSAGVGVTLLASAIADAKGIRIAQYRHKGSFTRARYEQAKAVASILKEQGVCFVINDRADIALALGADGLHVGQADLPPSVVRRLVGRGMLLGYSTHNRDQLADVECQWADYLAIGPAFATASKPNPDPSVGLEGIAEARTLTAKPLVAIGGITLENAREVLQAGADSVAMISGVSPSSLSMWTDLER